ncbi:serine threonine [Chlorella sorokiniana]|uniref:Serine threonine n=1 Tax=Chlorella sorokiniana TaxID=3076 RepID=A0A2P6TN57_CHLSO|nr:serine threonine [Chlorella sorokiniana]|eukprot:PRW50767.1 serine threonine [Chlorella sorokiniana]
MLRPLLLAALVGLAAGDLCRPGSPPAADFSCIECDSAGTACTECDYASFLHENGTCIACETVLPHCLECSDADTCTLCAYWYGPKLEGERLTCVRCADKRCVDCRDDWQECLECDGPPNGQPTSRIKGACVVSSQECGEGCTECTANGTCEQCDTGLGLVGGRCRRCAAGDGCERCDGDEKRCSSCEYDKALTDGRCVKCSQKTCISCPKGPDACELCGNDYYASENGTCLPFPEGCVSAKPNGTCSDCGSGYSLSAGACKRCTSAHCDRCEQGKLDQCVSCSPPDGKGSFALVNGTCVRCAAASCEVCKEDDSTVCEFCKIGYYKTAKGACLKATIEGCEVPSEDGKTCQTCEMLTGLVDGKCVQCNTDLRCLHCDGNPAKCSECDGSSRLDNGTCTLISSSGLPGCSTESGGKCISCGCTSMPDGSPCFTLMDGACRPCADPNCASCDTPRNCTDCRRYTRWDDASERCRMDPNAPGQRPDDVPSR